jgi:hypothetical protein
MLQQRLYGMTVPIEEGNDMFFFMIYYAKFIKSWIKLFTGKFIKIFQCYQILQNVFQFLLYVTAEQHKIIYLIGKYFILNKCPSSLYND